MAFWLSGKVVALYLDNSTANIYLYNERCTASLFLSRLACHIFNLANKHGITLILACMPTHLNVEADCLSWGKFVPDWYLLPHIPQAAFQLWNQTEVDLLAFSYKDSVTNIMS